MEKIGNFIKTELAERLDQIDQLVRLLEKYMALPLENRVWPLLHNRRMVLLTDDPHFATQARFMQKALCKHVNNELNLKLSGLDIKVISLPLASFGRKINRPLIKEETAATLRSIASQIEDEELGAALMSLAGTTPRQPDSAQTLANT